MQFNRVFCEMCNSGDLVKEGDVFVCQYCGCKYSVDTVRKMMIEGKVDVSGSKIIIDNSGNIENYRVLARRARNEGNIAQALKYYTLIQETNAYDWEALFYSTVLTKYNTKYAEINKNTKIIHKCVCDVFNIIEKNEYSEENMASIFTELYGELVKIIEYLDSISVRYYLRMYDSEDDMVAENCIDNFVALCNLKMVIGDIYKKYNFGLNMAVDIYESVFIYRKYEKQTLQNYYLAAETRIKEIRPDTLFESDMKDKQDLKNIDQARREIINDYKFCFISCLILASILLLISFFVFIGYGMSGNRGAYAVGIILFMASQGFAIPAIVFGTKYSMRKQLRERLKQKGVI